MEQKVTVATKSEAVLSMEPDWDMAEALLGGTDAMRDAGELYLPKWPKEGDESYKARLAVSTLFPAFKHTVHSLGAKPLSKEVTLSEDMKPDFKTWMENIDLEGRNVDQMVYDAMLLVMGPGLGGLLVEHQTRPEGAVTLADEKAAGLRPYLVLIKPKQIRGWRFKFVKGEAQLTMLRIMECVEEDDGQWMTKTVDQVRVLEPGKWTTYRKDQKEEWVKYKEGTNSITDIIPYVPLYGERTGFMTAKPPLKELAKLNIKHWQSQSDQDNILHVARVPILTVTGVRDGVDENGTKISWDFEIGAGAAIKLPSTEAKMEYVEHSGAAIEAGQASLDKLEDQMRQSGAELLVLTPGPKTATEVATDNSIGMSALQRIALSLQDAFNQAIMLMGRYAAIDNPGSIQLFMDFAAETLAEASASLLVGLKNSGGLSGRTLFDELKRRGILASHVDYDEEVAYIEEEGPPMSMLPPEQLPGNNKQPPNNKPGSKQPTKPQSE